jgi:hypothetical protein
VEFGVRSTKKMANPWLRKNPWLSLWLSAANRATAVSRNALTTEAHRQTTRAIAEGQRQMLEFWSGGWAGNARKRGKSRQRD